MLTVPEVFTHSSNIGAARMALMVGVEGHQAFLRKMGQLDRLRTELPESAEPLVPKRWGELNTMTIAFGQGLNVAPIQALMAVDALVNGGNLMTPTFLPRTEAEAAGGRPSRRQPTDLRSRCAISCAPTRRTARPGLANIPGYYVGGKTGTADKIIHGHYSQDKVFTTFMAITPADKPKYLYLVMYDEPHGTARGRRLPHRRVQLGPRDRGADRARASPLLRAAAARPVPDQPFPAAGAARLWLRRGQGGQGVMRLGEILI